MTLKQKFYDSYHKKNNNFYAVIKKNNFTYFEILRFFYDKVTPQLPSNYSNVKVLDVGCGVGTMAFYFASLGMKVEGIDVSKRAIAICTQAKNQLKYKNSKFEKKLLDVGTKQFDMVLTSEVIEHIEDEAEFLNRIKSHLKKDGVLFLTTPLKENLLYTLGFYKKFDAEVGHLRRYTVSSITSLLEVNGFTVADYKVVEGPLRNILFTTKLGFLIKFIKGPLVPLFHFLDWVTIQFFGASDILVLAKKSKSEKSKSGANNIEKVGNIEQHQ